MIQQESFITPNCKVVPMETSDALWLYTLFQDNLVKQYLPGTLMFSDNQEHTATFIANMIADNCEQRGFLWKIIHAGNPCGFICVIDIVDKPSCSYAIQSEYRNKGIMTECLDTILDCFNERGYGRLHFDIQSDNSYSILLCSHLLEKHSLYIHIK